MVGFISQPAKEEKNGGAKQPKLKNLDDPESFKFDFNDYPSEFDDLSLASIESFLDFDSIKDWIEEMQDPIGAEAGKVEAQSEVIVGSCLNNPNGNVSVDFVANMKDLATSVPVKVEYGDTNKHVLDNRDEVGGDDSMLEADGKRDHNMVAVIKEELVKVEPIDMSEDGHCDQINNPRNESGIAVLGDSNCGKIESLGCSIEEGLEKVSLVGGAGGSVVTGSIVNEKEIGIVSDKDDSDSTSESEYETSSTASSTSSSSSDSDDDDDEEAEKEKFNKINVEETADKEEGEIMDSEAEKMVPWSGNDDNDDNEDEGGIGDGDGKDFELVDIDEDDDDDDDLVKGPIKSKNEIQFLPPVPPVKVTLQPCHQILPVGVVSSILGAQVIVEGSEKHNPLNEGSILWITEKKLPLGLVDEIFGPVKNPYYIVRYNSESEVPSEIQNGTLIGFVLEFVDHVLNDKNLYQKGYDASGDNDEEVLDEVEFSDDEKEAEYRRILKMSKRGNNDQGSGNKKKNRRNLKSREKTTWTKDRPSPSQAPSPSPSQPNNQMQQHVRAHVPSSSRAHQPQSSPVGPIFHPRPGGPPAFPPQVQPAGVLLNGLGTNGMPHQQQNMAFPSGFQMNGMTWLQQNHPQAFQMPLANVASLQQQQFFPQFPPTNPAPPQQPFDLSQLVSGSSSIPLGALNFAAGPANSPWSGLLGPNFSNQAPLNVGLPLPNGPLPVFPGTLPNVSQPGQSFNSQPATSLPRNAGQPPRFNQGFSSGSGSGRKPFHRRGGHFGGGRGSQRSK